jgi:nitrilase
MNRTDHALPKVAAVQMSSGDRLDENLRVAGELLAEAAAEGCVMAVLPENFAYVGARDHDKLALAEREGNGPVQAFLGDAARRHSMWIVAGRVPLQSARPSLVFGACRVVDDKGAVRATYRKIHLFDVDLPDSAESYRESASMDRGTEPVTVDTPVGRLGVTICYDVRFPELYRRLVDSGATVFSVAAAFTRTTGTAHWHALLRARAIENLAYVVAAAQHGRHPNGRETFGHSMIVDPWGRLLAEKEAGDGLVIAGIDPILPEKIRRGFPVLEHRRL